jgi:hypothetical protein
MCVIVCTPNPRTACIERPSGSPARAVVEVLVLDAARTDRQRNEVAALPPVAHAVDVVPPLPAITK